MLGVRCVEVYVVLAYLCEIINTKQELMVTIDHIKDLCKRKDALRGYL